MPVLSNVSSSFIKRIRDSLKVGPGYASSTLTLGSATSAFALTAREPGLAGDSITVEVTAPGGTAGLAVSATGSAITIALAVSSGTPVGASNTALLITAAINASATVSSLVEASLVGSGAGSLSVASGPTALAGGATGTSVAAPLNFLRAQDMASVLELLQDGLDLPAVLTATGGTATSVVDTGAFAANTQVGNTVTFTGNTTAALAGVSATVVSNTANALFFAADALPDTPVSGDTYRIYGALVEPIIAELRDSNGSAGAATGNLYGDSRLVTDALVRMVRQLGGTVADKATITSGVSAAGSTTVRVELNTKGIRMRPDMFKGMRFTISGQSRKIVGNDETAVFFTLPLSGAPAESTAFTIVVPNDSTDGDANLTFAPGGQPGNNQSLAELIRLAQATVVAFVLPT